MEQSISPTALFTHIVFKAGGLFAYMFLSTRYQPNTITEIVIFLYSIGFWITKSITGRILVGLRWWSEGEETTIKFGLWIAE